MNSKDAELLSLLSDGPIDPAVDTDQKTWCASMTKFVNNVRVKYDIFGKNFNSFFI